MRSRFNKSILAIMFALILIVFAGCNRPGDQTTDISSNNTPTPVPTPTATPEPGLDDILPQQYVVELDIDALQYNPEIYYVGNDTIVLTWKNHNYDVPSDTANVKTFTATYNIATGQYTEGPQFAANCMFEHADPVTGRLLLSDYSARKYYILDSELNTLHTIDIANYGAKFNTDFSKYYMVTDGYLYEIDVATGTSTYISVPYGFRVSYMDTYDYVNNIIYLSVSTSPYSYGSAYMAYDIGKGELLSLTTSNIARFFYNGSAYAVGYGTGGFQLIHETDKQRYTFAPGAVEGTDMTGYMYIEGSPYFVKNYKLDEYGNYSGDIANKLYSFDGTSVLKCDFTAQSNSVFDIEDYLYDYDMLVAAMDNGGTWKVVVLRTDLMEFSSIGSAEVTDAYSIDNNIITSYQQDLVVPEVDEHLAALRQRADDLEKRYGIKIYFSNQCAKPLSNSSYVTSYTDNYSENYERDLISFALSEFEQVAARYPEGFFKQFLDAQGTGGINIFLVGSITSTNNTIAYFYKSNYTYNVALDVTYQVGQQGNFAHELWHAIETKMSDIDPDWQDGWDELNPDGFAYYDTYDYYDNDSVHWTYYDWRTDGVYFVDAYGKTYAKEDRARIMEKVMGDPGMADILMKHDTMKAKLTFMCDVIRKAFDTSDWGELYWERYLP